MKTRRKQSNANEKEHSSAKKQVQRSNQSIRVYEQLNSNSKDYPLLQLQRTLGNQAVQRLVKEGFRPNGQSKQDEDQMDEIDTDRIFANEMGIETTVMASRRCPSRRVQRLTTRTRKTPGHE